MNLRYKSIIPLLFLFSFGTLNLHAQDSTSNRYPSAVLVQLRSEHNRIEALAKAHEYKKMEEVKKDAAEVINRMKLDFETNYTYCPVFYYIDTNADLVKQKKFEGILMNADGTEAKNTGLNGNSTDYIIAFYGRPVSQPRNKRIETDSSKYVYDPEILTYKGLVILNDQFQQLTYYYKFEYDHAFFGSKKAKKYYYKSKHFDIEYYPFANLLQRTGLDRYGRRRILKTYPQ